MTSELPPEAHFYRNSTTPESPRPLHPPEPSAFPVLRNQMDPVFNDTTTYDVPVDPPATEIPVTAPPQPSEALLQVMSSTQPSQQSAAHAKTHEGENRAADIVVTDSSENQAIASNILAHSSNTAVSDLQRTLDSLAKVTQASDGTSEPVHNVSFSEGLVGADTENLRTADTIAAEDLQHPSTQNPPQGPAIVGESQYQSLFDAISKSTSDAVEPNVSESAAVAAQEDLPAARQSSENPIPSAVGLPPRPPPQDKPSTHPNYSATDDIQSFHQLSPQNVTSSSLQSPGSGYRPSAHSGIANSVSPSQATPRAANGLPPPPIATFQQPATDNARSQSPQVQAVQSYAPSADSPGRQQGSQAPEDEEQPWGPDIQRKYDDFLQSERKYVTEGIWDQFPPDSRLFIGNLPTEKVTKRDVFHIFHKHGKLAQISLKQAYGFVQFLESASSYAALEQEEGAAIRGRKIHLEISKPQRNSRNAGGEGRSGRRRSRSPDRRRGPDRNQYVDRAAFAEFRDGPMRRRDDYRPMRSPSPRGYRARDDYRPRNRSPGRYPQYERPRPNQDFGQSRGGSPRGFDDDAALPLPRRDPRDVPDVQILILEEVDQAFSRFVENGFKQKGLKAATIHLNPRITLGAVVKRQIIEGVQGVVKLTGSTQRTGRVPLQVFDRGGGATSVNFLEYVELDVSVAADIIIQARQKERSTYPRPEMQPRQPSYGYSQQPTPYNQPAPYSQPPSQLHQQLHQQHYPPYQAPAPQHHTGYPPQRDGSYGGPGQNPPQHNNGQNLQDLLANLRQMPQNQGPAAAANHMSPTSGTHDIGALLSNVARHQNPSYRPPMSQYQQPQPQPPQPVNNIYDQRGAGPAYGGTSGGPSGGPPYVGYGGAPQAGPSQDVRNIMDTFAKWKQ